MIMTYVVHLKRRSQNLTYTVLCKPLFGAQAKCWALLFCLSEGVLHLLICFWFFPQKTLHYFKSLHILLKVYFGYFSPAPKRRSTGPTMMDMPTIVPVSPKT